MMSKSKLSGLLKGKSVPNLPSYSSPWSKNDEKLWNAVKQQNVKQVRTLVSKPSVTPTKLGPQGKSVFHLACEIGNEQIVDAILANTQDVNEITIQGVTALQHAAAKGHTTTVDKLLKKHANVDQRDCDGMSALHHACFGQHRDCVKVLLQKNADPNAIEQGGKTPLFFSAHLGHVDICRWLIDRGADCNWQDKDNITPLMLAAKGGHKNVCEHLLRWGANPKLTDRNGRTAIEYAAASNNHEELIEVFHKAETKTFQTSSDTSRVSISDSGSHYNEILRLSPTQSTSSDIRGSAALSDDESVSHADVHSVHSMDDSLLPNHQRSPIFHRHPVQTGAEQAYRELMTEHNQLKEEYSKLSIEDLKLRDKVESLQRQLASKHEKDLAEDAVEKIKQLSERTEKTELMNSSARSCGDDVTGGNLSLNENKIITELKKEILALKHKNSQLMHATLPNGGFENVSNESSIQHQKFKPLFLEREQMEKQLSQEFLQHDKTLIIEVQSLQQQVASLQKELEVVKNEKATCVQKLEALLTEVSFDEEGFVEGCDMTKEEFLQAQNQQLKTQCGLLTEEMEKLRATLDAILKAGDNLQADYDSLTAEKDALQDELETALKEKGEVITENEFVLADNNELHENLKKLVHELEKMQDKYQSVQSENEELKRSVSVASKVGEVARLLEERGVLQQRCADLEVTSHRLQHDHDILLEEVQSLNESVNQLIVQRNQLSSDLEEMEPVCQQFESLQLEYGQLEMEFADLLREKEALEQQVSNNNEVKKEGEQKVLNNIEIKGESVMKEALGQQTLNNTEVQVENGEAYISELKSSISTLTEEKQQLQDVLNVLSRHNASVENKVKELERTLEQHTVDSVSQGVLRNGPTLEDSRSYDELKKNQEEVVSLKKQIVLLNQEIEEWERRHTETVTTYRTHLLSAVQGHMDPDVKDVLYHIIELRSMEQFC